MQHAHPLEARVEVGVLDVLPVEGARADLGRVVVQVGEDLRRVFGQLDLLKLGARLGALDRLRRK
eukprot:764023-Prymnesium_polylepis.1